MDHEHMNHQMVPGEASLGEYMKFSIVIIGIVTIATLLMYMTGHISFFVELRLCMGVFFAVFAVFKLIGYQMFAIMFAGYDVLAKRVKLYAYTYPFIELFLALLYLFDVVPILRGLITVGIMTIGTIGVWGEVRKRSRIRCACLGTVIKLPLSTVSLIEDVGMGLMALVMLVWHQ